MAPSSLPICRLLAPQSWSWTVAWLIAHRDGRVPRALGRRRRTGQAEELGRRCAAGATRARVERRGRRADGAGAVARHRDRRETNAHGLDAGPAVGGLRCAPGRRGRERDGGTRQLGRRARRLRLERVVGAHAAAATWPAVAVVSGRRGGQRRRAPARHRHRRQRHALGHGTRRAAHDARDGRARAAAAPGCQNAYFSRRGLARHRARARGSEIDKWICPLTGRRRSTAPAAAQTDTPWRRQQQQQRQTLGVAGGRQ